MLKTVTVICIGILFLTFTALAKSPEDKRETLKHPIADSRMSEKEAFDGLDPKSPAAAAAAAAIRKRQKIVKVKYYSFDGRIHQGQLVIDKDLVADIKKVFKFELSKKFPINTVIPVSAPQFRKKGRRDDDLLIKVKTSL